MSDLLSQIAALESQRDTLTPIATAPAAIDPQTTLANSIASGLALALSGAIGGKRGLEAGGATIGESFNTLQDAAKEQAKFESSAALKRLALINDDLSDLRKQQGRIDLEGVKADKKVETENRLQDLMLARRRAGKAEVNVNTGAKSALAPREMIKASLKASGRPEKELNELTDQLVANGTTVADLEGVGKSAKAAGAGTFGSSAIIKPVDGKIPSPEQQKKANVIASFGPSVVDKVNRLIEIFNTKGFDETSFSGPLAQETSQLMNGIILELAEAKDRGANLTLPEIKRLEGFLGVISATEGPGSLIRATVRKELGFEPVAALKNFKKRFIKESELQLLQNNYQMDLSTPQVSAIYGDVESQSSEPSTRLSEIQKRQAEIQAKLGKGK